MTWCSSIVPTMKSYWPLLRAIIYIVYHCGFYNGEIPTLIRQVRNWLAAQSRRNLIHAPAMISNYDEFLDQLPTIVSRLKYKSVDEITFNDSDHYYFFISFFKYRIAH
jgi:hypothetical protein